MTLLNPLVRYPQATYKNLSAHYQDSSVDGGRKTVTHEFPDSDTRYIEDLGKNQKVYTVNFLIDINTSKSKLDQWIKKLDEKEQGFLVHPLYGQQLVKVRNYNISDTINELGAVRLNVIFARAERNRFPDKEEGNLGFIGRLRKQVAAFIDDEFGTGVQDVTNALETFNNFNTAVQDSAREIKRIALTIQGSGSVISDFVTNINEVVNSSGALVQSPSVLASNLRSAFNNLETAYNSSADLFDVQKLMFDFDEGSNNPAIGSSTSSNTINNNQAQLNNYVRASALSSAYNAAANISYGNENELNLKREELEEGFAAIPTTIDRTVYQGLLDLRTQTNLYFDRLSISLDKVVEINVKPQPLTSLVYSLYGSLEKKPEIIALNSIKDPSQVSGTLKILSNV